jgi:prepilin-type N-terminal cleavage/methylation domain-containing protein
MGTRARDEQGFGLIELLIALTVLSFGILALFGAFNAGALSLRRASHISTAAALADKQMEGFRALTYPSIGLTGTIPGSGVYASDIAYSASQVTVATCAGSTGQCTASQTVTGPDGYGYEVDTYIVMDAGQKKVTVVVRDGKNLTGRALERETSSFSSTF